MASDRQKRLANILASDKEAVREHDTYSGGLPYEEDVLPENAPFLLDLAEGLHPNRNNPHHQNENLVRGSEDKKNLLEEI